MKKLLFIFLLLAGCLTYALAQQSGSCGDNLTWTLDEDGTLTISGTGAMNDYSAIGIDLPWRKEATRLVVEEGITHIGRGAFYDCSGFTGSLTLPESLTSIGDYAFYDCSGFTGSLVLPASLISIGDLAFAWCSGFSGDLTLPEGLTSIVAAFAGCSGFTGSLTLPASLTSIGESSFRYCGFTGNLSLPEGLTSIGASSFEECRGFTGTLTLPASLTSIDDNAFYNCRGFTGSLILPASLTNIGPEAFIECRGLTDTLMLPENLLNIGSLAFAGCGFSFVLNENRNPIAIPADVFNITLSDVKLCVPAGSGTAYSQAEVWKEFDIEEYGVGIHPSFDKAESMLACGTEVSISGATAEEEIYYGLGKDAAPTLRYTSPIAVSDTTYISAYSRVRNVYSDTIRATYIPEHASSFVGVEWNWTAEHTATLSLTCPRCKTDLKPVVSLSEELTKEATEEETGLKTYTATATANEVTYKSINREVLPKLTQPIHDTVMKIDTIVVADIVHDTIVKTDTIIVTDIVHDTIVITDTVYIEVGTGNAEAKTIQVKLYPNPTNGSFTVEAEEDAHLQIYDATGACIRSGYTQGGRFTGSLPTSGLYFIKLTSGNRTYTKRLIVR